MPPRAGLQLIWPSVSMLWVSRRVRAPIRAAASAASVPAWPPPMTITSKGWAKRIEFLGPGRGCQKGQSRIVGRQALRTRPTALRVMYPTVSLLLALGLFAAGGAGGAIAGAGTAVGAGAAAGAGVPQQGVSGVMVPGGLGPLALSACQLEDPAKVSVVLAECGELSVLENPSDSNGRNLRLH